MKRQEKIKLLEGIMSGLRAFKIENEVLVSFDNVSFKDQRGGIVTREQLDKMYNNSTVIVFIDEDNPGYYAIDFTKD
jgi:hypothetical protein